MKVLITGAAGQLGRELVPFLQSLGAEVHPTDLRVSGKLADQGYSSLDVRDKAAMYSFIRGRGITHAYHLAAILSGKGEENPGLAYEVNMNGLHNLLEAAKDLCVVRVFVPSSIAVYGPDAPKDGTPERVALNPRSIYGITKVSGELLQDYYRRHYGLDVRSLRFPGLISHVAEPGGGTTDFAPDMIRAAAEGRSGKSFLAAGSKLPFLYMPDALRAIERLMQAETPRNSLVSYNVTGFSAGPEDIEGAIKTLVPDFHLDYAPDHRQAIADSWPRSIDDGAARSDWGWSHDFGLQDSVADMIGHLCKKKLQASRVAS